MKSQDLLFPLPQSPEYARTLAALGVPVRSGSTASGLHWQLQARRLPWLGHVELLSRGPVGPADIAPADWLPPCRDGRRCPLLLNAAHPAPEALRAAGFWPLMTPATIAMLPLDSPQQMRAAMHQKWRNQMRRAAALRITRHPLTATHWLLGAETRQARQRRYRNLPPALMVAFARANPGKALIWEARHNRAPIAAIAVLRHGAMATWQIGVTRPEGRGLNAMNALLWTAMCWLSENGQRQLDLGLLNSDDAPGLTRFKLRSGARAQRLGGTWVHMGALAPLARRLPKRLAT